MTTINTILGNCNSDEWRRRLKETTIETLELDQWSAQKSRLIIEKGAERYCISLNRHTHLKDGDIVLFNEEKKSAVVVRIKLAQVMVINLEQVATQSKEELIRTTIELGHAIGNQHWPAVVKGDRVYVPLTLDKKVMESVMKTHNFANIDIQFQEGESVIPYLSPHDIRYLFAGLEEKHHAEHH